MSTQLHSDNPHFQALERIAPILSDGDDAFRADHVGASEVAALFDVVVTGDDGPRKPDPAAFRAAARAVGVPVERCVVVDDEPANLRGAREAGAIVVGHVDAATTVFEVEVLLDLHLE